MNLSAFHWINGWSNAYAPFYDFLSEGTKILSIRLALALLFLILIAAGPQTRRAAIFAVLGFLLANTFTEVFKHLLPMPRPCVELVQQGQTVMHHGVGWLTSAGTASAHAANTAAVAFAFTYFLRWWGLIPIAIAFFTGLSRIYVGVHYPYQVLLGWACGIVVGAILIYGWNWIQVRRRIRRNEEEPPDPMPLFEENEE